MGIPRGRPSTDRRRPRGGELRRAAARGGSRRLDSPRGPRAGPALPPAAAARRATCRARRIARPRSFARRSGGPSSDIDLLTRTSVMKLDPAERMATLSNKEEVRFGSALLATGRERPAAARRGGRPRWHPLPPRVRQFRRDPRRRRAGRIRGDDRRQLHRVRGGGVARRDLRLPLHDRDARARLLRAAVRSGGRRVLPGRARGARCARYTEATSSSASRASDGRVERVVTKGGLELDCDCVVIGAGVMPDVMLARAAGLELGEQRRGQVLLATGDLCRGHLRGRRHVRVRERGPRSPVARRALGRGDPAGQDCRAQHARPRRAARHRAVLLLRPGGLDVDGVRRARARASRSSAESLEEGNFTAFYVDERKVTAALSVGRSEDLEHARRLIVEGATVDPARLADDVGLAPRRSLR